MDEGHSRGAESSYSHLEGDRVEIREILELDWITRVRIFGETVALIFVLELGNEVWNAFRIFGGLVVTHPCLQHQVRSLLHRSLNLSQEVEGYATRPNIVSTPKLGLELFEIVIEELLLETSLGV